MDCLKSGFDIFLKRIIQTSVVNSHTVTYKPIAPADNHVQLEFNFSGHSDYYIDLNSVRLLLRIKLVKKMVQIYIVLNQTQLVVSTTFYIQCLVLSLSR